MQGCLQCIVPRVYWIKSKLLFWIFCVFLFGLGPQKNCELISFSFWFASNGSILTCGCQYFAVLTRFLRSSYCLQREAVIGFGPIMWAIERLSFLPSRPGGLIVEWHWAKIQRPRFRWENVRWQNYWRRSGSKGCDLKSVFVNFQRHLQSHLPRLEQSSGPEHLNLDPSRIIREAFLVLFT